MQFLILLSIVRLVIKTMIFKKLWLLQYGKLYCNIETIHDSLPPYHWRFTGLERQNDSNLFVWGGGVGYTGGNTWVLSPCLITQPHQEPWPCSQPYIMKGWLYMQFSISVRSPHKFERGMYVILLTVLSNPARTRGKGVGRAMKWCFWFASKPSSAPSRWATVQS